MLDRLIARVRRRENIQRVSYNRLAQFVGLLHRRFGHLGFEALEELVAGDALFSQHPNGIPRIVLIVDDNAGTLPSVCAHSRGGRPVDDVARGPDARPSNGSVANAFPLGEDPVHRIVGDGRAGCNAEVEIKLAHPIAQVAVAVDESRQDRLALGVDDIRALG